jgi:S-adenosylmethionine hydrolase
MTPISSSSGKMTAFWLVVIILISSVLIVTLNNTGGDDAPSRPLVLYTDFGTESYRVPQMMGYIYSMDGQANVVEASHNVEAFNVKEGAFLIYLGAQEFPDDAVFVGVVSPGQTVMEHIVVEIHSGQLFVAPNNGLLTYVLDNMDVDAVYNVSNTALFDEPMSEMSTTKITTQVGAMLADGYELADVGTKISNPVKLSVQNAEKVGNVLLGEISLVDHFGNCISNIPSSLVDELALQKGDAVTITIGSVAISAIYGTTYGDVPIGDAVVFVHSLDLLELSINMGNFADTNSAGIGTAFSLEKA